MSEPSPSGKRLLSIDGGGFRGLGSLLVIEAIAAAAHTLCRKPGTQPIRPCDIFDIISGSSTGGLLAVLLGRLGLDCTTAIQEYKTLSQKLFGDDRDKFMDVLTIKGAVLDPAAYENAIADLVVKHGENQDLPFVLSTTPAQTTQTAVLTMARSARFTKWVLSWKPSTPPWLIKDLIRQSTAAPIYLSPLQLSEPKPNIYEDIAYSGHINSTQLVMKEAKNLWKEDAKVIVSIGQWFSSIAVKGMSPDRAPGDAEAQPFVGRLLDKYSVNVTAGTGGAEDVVKKVLQQAAKTVKIDTELSSVQGYYRVDPSLGPNASWELVDHFIPNVESSVKAWLETPESKKLIDEIATKLVVPLPKEPPKPVEPHDMDPPPANPGTHKPNEQCEKPRPSTMDNYLKNYNIIFVIDDSGSMLRDMRWEEARDALGPIADYALEYFADTIDMYFLNHKTVYKPVKSSKRILQIFDEARPPKWHRTPTAKCLDKILNTIIDKLNSTIETDPAEYKKIKPFDIILLTDGVPDDKPVDTLEEAWRKLQEGKHHPNYVGVQIVQIGNDPNAIHKLKELKKGNFGSMVDTVSYDGVVTSEKLQRILLGAVHPNVRAKLS